MTKQQLLNKATSKNYQIELSENVWGNQLIGVSKGKNCWHWFEVVGEDLLFRQTYSQNTGETKKGIMHSLKVIQSFIN